MPGTAMRIMTISAGRLALGNRVTRWQVQFRAHASVTIEADLLRGLFSEHKVFLFVSIVAAVAAEVLLLVFTAGPEHLICAVVAALTARCAHFWLRNPLRAEADVR